MSKDIKKRVRHIKKSLKGCSDEKVKKIIDIVLSERKKNMMDRIIVDNILGKTESRLELEEKVEELLKSENSLRDIQLWILERDIKIIELTNQELQKGD